MTVKRIHAETEYLGKREPIARPAAFVPPPQKPPHNAPYAVTGGWAVYVGGRPLLDADGVVRVFGTYPEAARVGASLWGKP